MAIRYYSATHRTRIFRTRIFMLLAIAALLARVFTGLLGLSPLRALPAAQSTNGPETLPLAFEPNVGQSQAQVCFLARGTAGDIFFTSSEVVLNTSHSPLGSDPQSGVVRVRFANSSETTTLAGESTLAGKVNYLVGRDATKWQTDVPTYSRIVYKGLYAGVDLKYEGTNGQLKGTYSVAAGADPAQIRWSYANADKLWVDAKGNLQVTVGSTTVTEQAPLAWQEIEGRRVAVNASYLIAADNSISFRIGPYSRAQALTIDPVLAYSTFLGGGGTYGDTGFAVAVDSAGNMYVAGETLSPDFPTAAPFQPAYAGATDAFVTKFNAAGSALIYSTYLGGSAFDQARGIAVDGAGNAYVTGYTQSTNFPVVNAYQSTSRGNDEAFVTKLNPAGGALYSTYLGGPCGDSAWGIAVDGAGSAYVTGMTCSSNFPVVNAYQPNYAGGNDAFITKFNPAGSALSYSTFLGGGAGDRGYDIALDGAGNIYVTGQTYSANFPLANPFQPAYAGGTGDTFVSKLNSGGSALVYSTYLGGSGTAAEEAFGIAVDGAGSAYVTGRTGSTDFPTVQPIQGSLAGQHDAFVAKFTPAGSSLAYSTYLGGTNPDEGHGIAVDPVGNAYVAGMTLSTDFPLVNPIINIGGNEAFVTKVSTAGSSYSYSTFLGACCDELAWGIAADALGNAYVVGETGSYDFPVVNAYQWVAHGHDAFLSKIYEAIPQVTPTSTSGIPTSTNTAVASATPTRTNTPLSSSTPTRTGTRTNTPIVTSTNTPTRTNTPASSSTPTHTSTPAGTSTSTSTGTPPTATNTPTNTLSMTPTPTAGSPTSTPSATAQTCIINFSDVPPGSTFYEYVRCLVCRGIISGYPDGTFRPNSQVTRGQLSKMVANSAGYSEIHTERSFQDVPVDSTYYQYIQRLYSRHIVSGYACSGSGEPCVPPQNLPYFRPNAYVTRGQMSKIVAIARGLPWPPNGQRSFQDVPHGSAFWPWIEALAATGAISGYPCGAPGEPCVAPNNLPYFRGGANVTRGQATKIISLTFFPGCVTPGRR